LHDGIIPACGVSDVLGRESPRILGQARMSAIAVRSGIALVVLAAGWLCQRALEQHVLSAGPLPEVSLNRPLAELPMELGDWRGADRPITDDRQRYADEHLQRIYVSQHDQQAVSLWIVYSRQGEDRGHHPEVCMAVAGRPEDPTVRQAFAVDGHSAPVQQFRFGTPGDQWWVFYWHYTLVPPKGAELTNLQRFYQRLHRRPSSVTLEVFAPENGPDDGEHAREFVKRLDAAMQAHLGPTAVRGSQRTPVTVIAGPPPATETEQH
jgi:Protein of unknown function (DUF3485)